MKAEFRLTKLAVKRSDTGIINLAQLRALIVIIPTTENILIIPKVIVILRLNDKDMGATKTDLFTKKQNDLANMAKALGHPARIAILQQLIKTNACICGDLVDELGLAQPTISQHLKELKNAGLIQGTVEGTSVCYCINPKVWSEYKEILSGFFADIAIKSDCC